MKQIKQIRNSIVLVLMIILSIGCSKKTMQLQNPETMTLATATYAMPYQIWSKDAEKVRFKGNEALDSLYIGESFQRIGTYDFGIYTECNENLFITYQTRNGYEIKDVTIIYDPKDIATIANISVESAAKKSPLLLIISKKILKKL